MSSPPASDHFDCGMPYRASNTLHKPHEYLRLPRCKQSCQTTWLLAASC